MTLAAACVLTGCGGGGFSTVITPPTTTTTDMGTLATLADTNSYTIKNASSSMALGISAQSQTAGAIVVQESTSATDTQWHFIPMNNSQYNIENMLTHQVLGVSGASIATGAQVVQYADNGASDHIWQFYLLSDNNYLIKNVKSGDYLEDANSGATSSATIDQGARSSSTTGCTCQEWALTSGAAAYSSPATVSVSYSSTSDSSAIGIHDPSMVKAGSLYYLFSTHGAIHAHQSSDRTTFSDDGYALSSLPSWTNTYTASSGDLWAPDASYHGAAANPYWLYYAASTFGSTNSAIGLSTSSNGVPGTFIDSGAAIYTSANCPGSNAIDPASVVDTAGNAWMVFGSWSSGIQIVPVNNTTGVPTGATCTQLAYHPSGSGIEGAFIYPHGGYYYLFASIDSCCAGTSSTYRVIVGRSTSVNGPYTDHGGVALTAGGGTIVLSAHDNVNGPGGQTVLKDTTGDILVYHYYDGNNNGYPGVGFNTLGWTSDGWPYVH